MKTEHNPRGGQATLMHFLSGCDLQGYIAPMFREFRPHFERVCSRNYSMHTTPLECFCCYRFKGIDIILSGIKDRLPAFQVALWPRPSWCYSPHLSFQLSNRRAGKSIGHQVPGLADQPSNYLTPPRARSRNHLFACARRGVADLRKMFFSQGMLHSPLKCNSSVHHHHPRYRCASISLFMHLFCSLMRWGGPLLRLRTNLTVCLPGLVER